MMKTLLFGNYWQTNSKDKEPIEWIILKEESDKMYVLSKYCLDSMKYNFFRGTRPNWKNSDIREWLNQYFINAAFSPEEQKQILLSTVKTNTSLEYRLDDRNTVQDKVFLMSGPEAILYFRSDTCYGTMAERKRMTRATIYAYENGLHTKLLNYGLAETSVSNETCVKETFDTTSSDGYIYKYTDDHNEELPLKENSRLFCDWWLRSFGKSRAWVDAGGVVRSFNRSTDPSPPNRGIRPAMWIKK